MVHARKDYNRFQDPALTDPSLISEGSTAIAEDEPVFLVRAKDCFMIDVLLYYRNVIAEDLTNKEQKNMIINQLDVHIKLTHEWQDKNSIQEPTSVEV